ncbi:MAG: membrane protein-like, partial [uncultured Solirubrobacteraceae bacterium]
AAPEDAQRRSAVSRAGPDRPHGGLAGGALGGAGHRLLDRRGPLGGHRRPSAHGDPRGPAPGRLAAAVLRAPARLDGVVRRQRGGDARAVARLRPAQRAGGVVGPALAVRRARGVDGRRPAGAQPVPDVVRAGDAHVRPRRAARHADLRRLPARHGLRSPELARAGRGAPRCAALHAQLGPVLRDRLRPGLAGAAGRHRPGAARRAGALGCGDVRRGRRPLPAVAADDPLPGRQHGRALGAGAARLRAAPGLPAAARLHGAVRPAAGGGHRPGADLAPSGRRGRAARRHDARGRLRGHGARGVAVVAAGTGVGPALSRRVGPAAAAARRAGHLARRRSGTGRAGCDRRALGLRRASAREEQRARVGADHRAGAGAGGSRRLDAARADPGAGLLPARRPALRDALGSRVGSRRHRLARRRAAAGGHRRPARPRAAHTGARAGAPAGPDRAHRLRRGALERAVDGADPRAQRRVARPSACRPSPPDNRCRPLDLLSCSSEPAEGDGLDPDARRL